MSLLYGESDSIADPLPTVGKQDMCCVPFSWRTPSFCQNFFITPPKKNGSSVTSLTPFSQPLWLRNRLYLASQLWWGEHFVRRSLPESRNQPFTGPGAQCTTVQPKSQQSWTRRCHIRGSRGSQLRLNCTYGTCSHYKVDSSDVNSLDLPLCGNLSLFAFLMPVQVM